MDKHFIQLQRIYIVIELRTKVFKFTATHAEIVIMLYHNFFNYYRTMSQHLESVLYYIKFCSNLEDINLLHLTHKHDVDVQLHTFQ